MAKKRTKPATKKPRIEAPIPDNNWKVLLILLAVSYLIYVVWGLLTNSTWDDDCASRYFRTLNTFRDAREFIILWNRPLFVIVFCIPIALLGKIAIPLVMSAISALGAYFLYLTARELKYAYPLLLVPFLLFQPYFLGTGRDAMTEPMAATVIAWGIYAALKHRWLLFALLGSILPLARTELATLLPIWAFVLFRAKQYKYIPLLGAGVVLWDLAGWIIDGDPLYIYNETLGKADEENRYGSQPFLTYFQRYFYVVGPVVFYFFVLGFIDNVRKLNLKPLVMIQFIAGFLIYTLFAWKITIGQSAGFLRNLIPLSPLVALIALDGFEYYAGTIKRKKQIALLLLICMAVGALTIFAFPYEIFQHHSISKSKAIDYLNVSIVAGLTILLSLGAILHKVLNGKHLRGLAIATGIATLAYALYTEPPGANMNSEREMMNNLVKCYQECGLEKAPRTLCAHLWFHWVGDYVPLRKGSKYLLMNKDSMDAAPVGSVIIWESHYSNRLGNNIELADLSDASKYCLLGTFYPEDATKVAYMYIKKQSDKTAMQYLDEMITKNPECPELFIRRSTLYSEANNPEKALEDLNAALKLNPNSNTTKLNLANFYLRTNRPQDAIGTAQEIVKSNDEFIAAYTIMGSAYFNQSQFNEAINTFNKILEKDKDNKEALYNIGLSYLRLNNTDEGCKNLQRASALGMTNAQGLITQYCK